MKASVLIVDDDELLRKALSDRFRFWGHNVDEARGGEEALSKATSRHFDLILLDLAMPGLSGLEVLRQLRERGTGGYVVVLTAHGSVEAAVEAMKLGAADFLTKPTDFDILATVVNRSLEQGRLERVNRALADRLAPESRFIMGKSGRMEALLETAARVAQSRATILLTGESGTGKQILAEYIHSLSQLASGPFVYINCVALSDDLIESTLFGHEKGAFTGALARKEGRIETARGGTAFLDEVGDITPRLQTKLLHFLETGEFERVGGARTMSVDCRIISATNRNLPKAVSDGSFREDLFYRLNVIHLELPPLRERPEDIPLLARRFIEQSALELKRVHLELADRTLDIMKSYGWPGNIRQLRNAVMRMAVLARDEILGPELLPPEILGARGGSSSADGDLTLHDAGRRFEKEYIAGVLQRCGGNQTQAAMVLGLQRTHLNRKMKDLGLR